MMAKTLNRRSFMTCPHKPIHSASKCLYPDNHSIQFAVFYQVVCLILNASIPMSSCKRLLRNHDARYSNSTGTLLLVPRHHIVMCYSVTLLCAAPSQHNAAAHIPRPFRIFRYSLYNLHIASMSFASVSSLGMSYLSYRL